MENISKIRKTKKIMSALELNSHELSKTYYDLVNKDSYMYYKKICFLEKDEIELNYLLLNVQKDKKTEFDKENKDFLKKYEHPYVDEKVDTKELAQNQEGLKNALLQNFDRYLRLVDSHAPQSMLYLEFPLIQKRANIIPLNNVILNDFNNSNIVVELSNKTIWNRKKKIYLAISMLYERKAELLKVLISEKEDLCNNFNVIKLFNIIDKIYFLKVLDLKCNDENYKLNDDEAKVIDDIVNGDITFENSDFNHEEIKKEIIEISQYLKKFIDSKILSMDNEETFDDDFNKMCIELKIIMNDLLLRINIDSYYTK